MYGTLVPVFPPAPGWEPLQAKPSSSSSLWKWPWAWHGQGLQGAPGVIGTGIHFDLRLDLLNLFIKFHWFPTNDRKTNWTIGSLPKDDAFTAIFWIWIWWHIKIILQASECHILYFYASFHTSWCSCMKNTTTASWHHNSIQDIYTCGYIIYTCSMRITILQMTYAV